MAMMIRLQTSQAHDIPNIQLTEISAYDRNWGTVEIPHDHPNAHVGQHLTAMYNCHGLTFASRRTRIPDTGSIQLILQDDAWNIVANLAEVRAGDVVVYSDDQGDATHSGLVVDNSPLAPDPLILSKWGSGPEVIHRYLDVPDIYGKTCRFYRCHL